MLFLLSGDHRALPVHTHSCPARRSSNLLVCGRRFYHSCPLHTPVNFRRARSHSLWDMPKAAAPTSWHASSPTSCLANGAIRSEEHTSELQSLMRISYAVSCLKKIIRTM